MIEPSSPAPGEDLADTDPRLAHPGESHESGHASKLNWLRAGVLGANDGIISQAGLLMGVAGATTSSTALLAAGIAGMAAGAISMALGEYVSVSSQRDAERDLIAKERRELEEDPEIELEELTALYRAKGLSEQTATQVARELTEHDALGAHLDAELGIDPDELTNPIAAAVASAISFLIGSAVPTLAILLFPTQARIIATVVAVLLALALTGWVSASIGGGSRLRAVGRLVVGGAAAMAISYGVGALASVLFGTNVKV
ncbi:VIT1/CCC1 transporter family protein [Cumulibacter manganitolerans]|uniref:VIT1/CCC1 transporter family protein n=1 Tax=Cumulibacter manganitolerans TaxID=1884992 RepID=UPI001295FC97|nr:VIT family protein [Cumulibacter manganitolerans]